jgi:integration host factor subunit beta
MIKSELVQRISLASPRLYQRDVEKVVNAILDVITTAMARGDRVELRGFGTFAVKTRPARAARNPEPERWSRFGRSASRFSKLGRRCGSA